MQLWGLKFERELWHSLASALVVLVGATLAWLLLSRVARRARAHLEDVLREALSSDDWGEVAISRKRLTALRLVVNGARYAGVVVFGLLLAAQFDIAVNGLLLPAGFLGAALGLGAQNVVRDFLSGLFLLFEGQFAVGDAVTINGVTGTVEEVGVRVTRLRDDGGQVFFIPNGAITSVARLSRRGVPLIISVPLLGHLSSAQIDEIETTLRDSLQHLAQIFDTSAEGFARIAVTEFEVEEAVQNSETDDVATPEMLSATTETIEEIASEVAPVAPIATPEAIGFARWSWQVHSLRATLWREKAPAHLMAALRHKGLGTHIGSIEIFAAPVNLPR